MRGPAGPAGAAGQDGQAGPTGPAGPAGQDGQRGPTGPAGQDGQTGPAGPAGSNGTNGTNGTDGSDGGTPRISVHTDSARRVLQLEGFDADGTFTAESSPTYLGPSGPTTTLADAVDIRGPAGSGGGGTTVTANPSGTAGDDLNRIAIDGTNYNIPDTGTTVTANPSGTSGSDITRISIAGTDYNIPDTGSIVTANPSGTSGTELTRLAIDGTDYNLAGGSGGTTVTANPAGTDGDDLTRISIGGTNYNLPDAGTLEDAQDITCATPETTVAADGNAVIPLATLGAGDVATNLDITNHTIDLEAGSYLIELRALFWVNSTASGNDGTRRTPRLKVRDYSASTDLEVGEALYFRYMQRSEGIPVITPDDLSVAVSITESKTLQFQVANQPVGLGNNSSAEFRFSAQRLRITPFGASSSPDPLEAAQRITTGTNVLVIPSGARSRITLSSVTTGHSAFNLDTANDKIELRAGSYMVRTAVNAHASTGDAGKPMSPRVEVRSPDDTVTYGWGITHFLNGLTEESNNEIAFDTFTPISLTADSEVTFWLRNINAQGTSNANGSIDGTVNHIEITPVGGGGGGGGSGTSVTPNSGTSTTPLTSLAVGSATYDVASTDTTTTPQAVAASGQAGDSLDAAPANHIHASNVQANTGTATATLATLSVSGTTYNVPSGGGTSVTANPAGTGGSDLTRIQIGGTNYNIHSSREVIQTHTVSRDVAAAGTWALIMKDFDLPASTTSYSRSIPVDLSRGCCWHRRVITVDGTSANYDFMFVVGRVGDNGEVKAYSLRNGARYDDYGFTLDSLNGQPTGIYVKTISGTDHFMVPDQTQSKVFAYVAATGARASSHDFNLDSNHTFVDDGTAYTSGGTTYDSILVHTQVDPTDIFEVMHYHSGSFSASTLTTGKRYAHGVTKLTVSGTNYYYIYNTTDDQLERWSGIGNATTRDTGYAHSLEGLTHTGVTFDWVGTGTSARLWVCVEDRSTDPPSGRGTLFEYNPGQTRTHTYQRGGVDLTSMQVGEWFRSDGTYWQWQPDYDESS